MCHYYRGSRKPPAHLANEFSVRSNLYQMLLPDEGFYPLSQVPVVRSNESGERELVAAEWGFLPGWWKPTDKTPKRTTFQRKCFNARSEEVDIKPTYREAFRRRRCLMPAAEFFELGHGFHLAEHRTFAFAALWDRWRDGDGAVVETCTMLTTEPNEAVAGVGHNRMPVIFTGEVEYARWLDTEIVERSPLEDLMRPTPGAIWQLHRPAAEANAQDSTGRSSKSRPDGQGSIDSQGHLFD